MDKMKRRLYKQITVVIVGLLALALPGFSEAAPIYYTDFTSFDAATSTTLVEDFEAIFPKDIALASFSSNGNTYTGFGGVTFPNVFVSSPGYTNYGIPVTTSSILTANGDEDFTVDFGVGTNVLGFDTYLNSYGPATIQLFSSSGLIDTYSLTQDPGEVGFFGVVASEAIVAMRWTTIGGAVINTGIDNIRQGTVAPVPEPGTLLLLSSGLAGLVACRKKLKVKT